jgi:hypothetical protein
MIQWHKMAILIDGLLPTHSMSSLAQGNIDDYHEINMLKFNLLGRPMYWFHFKSEPRKARPSR